MAARDPFVFSTDDGLRVRLVCLGLLVRAELNMVPLPPSGAPSPQHYG